MHLQKEELASTLHFNSMELCTHLLYSILFYPILSYSIPFSSLLLEDRLIAAQLGGVTLFREQQQQQQQKLQLQLQLVPHSDLLRPG